MTQPHAQVRLTLDVTYALNGEDQNEMTARLQRQAEYAIGNGLLTGDTAAEVDEYSMTTVIVSAAPSEEAVTDHLMAQLTSGSLQLKDVPATLAHYGFMEVPAFIEELQKQGVCAVAKTAMEEFILEFAAFKEDQAEVIASLVAVVTPVVYGLKDFFYDQVDALKDSLGSTAANASSDDTEAQEAAISDAESWVASNVSGNLENEIAATLWLTGIDDGVRLIRAELPQ